MKVFISQYMGGKSNDEIYKERALVVDKLNKRNFTVIDSVIQEEPPLDVKNKGVWYMAKSLELLSKCDAIYFMDGWRKGKGCHIEKLVSDIYNVDNIN